MRPNLLYIMTDQQSADAMSCTGNPHLQTPALDSLAAESIRFDAAYTSYPLCVPARMSMFTGRMPHELGIYVNTQETDGPLPAPLFSPRIRDAGYRCHYVGKWHLTLPEARRQDHAFTIDIGGGYGGLDKDKAADAVTFLQQPQDDPFFLVVSFNNPHDCCELARGQELRMAPIPEPPPEDQLPPLPPNLGDLDDIPQVLRDFQLGSPGVGRANTWDELQIRQYRWGYNRLVEMVDAEIGKVLDALRASGHWENTLIIFTSDHGDGQGAHRWNQKWCLYDESSRVPLLVKPPGPPRAPAVDDRPVSATLDLAPTLCDYAGASPPEPIRGRSLRPIVEGRESPARPYVASETTFGNWAPIDVDEGWPRARMIRTERHKYVAYSTGDEQLFDLVQDPGEMHNLATDPAHADCLATHRAHLRDWCRRTDDTTFQPPHA